MSATGRSGEAGTTLVETMVALAILGMISGLMFPAIERGLQSLALKRAAATLSADLRTARATALVRGVPVSVTVADDGRSYSRGGVSSPAPAPVRLSSGGGPIVFFADGGASGGRVLLSIPGRQQAVAIDPATGLVAGGGA